MDGWRYVAQLQLSVQSAHQIHRIVRETNPDILRKTKKSGFFLSFEKFQKIPYRAGTQNPKPDLLEL